MELNAIAYPAPPTPDRFKTLSILEPGHIGNVGETMLALKARHRVLISAVRDAPTVLQLIRTHKVNGVFLGPLAINDFSRTATQEDFASLKLVWTGTGVIPEPIMAAFAEKLPGDAEFYYGYGSTE